MTQLHTPLLGFGSVLFKFRDEVKWVIVPYAVSGSDAKNRVGRPSVRRCVVGVELSRNRELGNSIKSIIVDDRLRQWAKPVKPGRRTQG